MIRAIRILLIGTGVAAIGYGALQILGHPGAELLSIIVWFAGGILLHDAIFAPMCIALGFAGRRVLPRSWWAPTAVGALASVALVAVAVPVVTRRGARAVNPTILDRNYVAGLAIALLVVWGLVAVELLRRDALPIASRYVRRQSR
ncbi:hypothetical protein [Antrihabitans spumae]|uniref:Uncharacterized protein n=1 Tax=Antrihabitans spumae TaxID=3373370 RepID=A0ABW7KHV8_9NOCA